jgi:hypothetical protein
VEPELFVHFAEISAIFVGFGALISLCSARPTDTHDVVYLQAVLGLGIWASTSITLVGRGCCAARRTLDPFWPDASTNHRCTPSIRTWLPARASFFGGRHMPQLSGPKTLGRATGADRRWNHQITVRLGPTGLARQTEVVIGYEDNTRAAENPRGP